MLTRLGQIYVTILLVVALGGQWALLQTVAWTTMLTTDLQSNSLGAAVSMTFDGKHLCPLCRAIAAGKQSEKKSTSSQNQRFDGLPPRPLFTLIAPSRLNFVSWVDSSSGSILREPPTPPPRSLFI
jgi:hypothetical protein